MSEQRVPDTFELRLRLPAADVLDELEKDPDIDVLAGMPSRDDVDVARFIALVREGGFVLRRSPLSVDWTEDDDRSNQRIELLASVRPVECGSVLEARFRFSPARRGYWALGSFAFAMAIGTPQALVVTALLFLLVNVPNNIDARRLELVAKLSDTLGPFLIDEGRAPVYR